MRWRSTAVKNLSRLSTRRWTVYRLYTTEFNMQHLFRYQTDISDNLPSKLLKRISIPMKTRASAGLNGN